MTARNPTGLHGAHRPRPIGSALVTPSGSQPNGGARIGLTRQLITGTPPDLASMHRLAWDGCEALLDLRSETTPFAAFNAVAAMRDAQAVGLPLFRRPVDRVQPDAGAIAMLVRDFRRPTSITYAFCDDGRLSLMLALMADDRILTAGHLQARMAAWGAPLLDAALRVFLEEWYSGAAPAPPRTVVATD